MKTLTKFCAAVVCALGFATTGAAAAEMPTAASGTGSLTGGASQLAALPALGRKNAKDFVQVAQRRRRRFRRSRRGRRIGAGVALGILGVGAAIALSQGARARERRYYGPSRRQCRRWLRRCDRGIYRACRRFDRRC